MFSNNRLQAGISIHRFLIFLVFGMIAIIGFLKFIPHDQSKYNKLNVKKDSQMGSALSDANQIEQLSTIESIRTVLIEIYQKGVNNYSDYVTIKHAEAELTQPVQTSVMFMGPNNGIHPMIFNSAGIEAAYKDKYIISSESGIGYSINSLDVLQADIFESLRNLYREGAKIELLGFPEGSMLSPRNTRFLIPGNQLSSSFVIENLDMIRDVPDHLSHWKPVFKDTPISKVYSLNLETGQEGEFLGWIMDVFMAEVTLPKTRPVHFILKAVFMQPSDFKDTHFLIALPDGGIFGEDVDNPFIYHGQVLSGKPASGLEKTIKRLFNGSVIDQVNFRKDESNIIESKKSMYGK